VPTYEYRCRTCDTTFELRRAMSESDDPAACPQGHDDTTRLLSVFASVSSSGDAAPSGPCGGDCACFPN
jgi:putative FmdB family regulatory protein